MVEIGEAVVAKIKQKMDLDLHSVFSFTLVIKLTTSSATLMHALCLTAIFLIR